LELNGVRCEIWQPEYIDVFEETFKVWIQQVKKQHKLQKQISKYKNRIKKLKWRMEG